MDTNGTSQPNGASTVNPTLYTAQLTVTNTNIGTTPFYVRQSSEFADVNLANREALNIAVDWVGVPITSWDLFSAGASSSGATRIYGLFEGVSIVCIVKTASPISSSDSEGSLVSHSRRLAESIS